MPLARTFDLLFEGHVLTLSHFIPACPALFYWAGQACFFGVRQAVPGTGQFAEVIEKGKRRF
jgi:hypothetical protein